METANDFVNFVADRLIYAFWLVARSKSVIWTDFRAGNNPVINYYGFNTFDANYIIGYKLVMITRVTRPMA